MVGRLVGVVLTPTYSACWCRNSCISFGLCFPLSCVAEGNIKKGYSQGGERSEATSAFEMVPSLVRCSCILFGLRWGSCPQILFSQRAIFEMPKDGPRTPQKRIQGGGFTHVHIPLENPPLRWRIFVGWGDSSHDLCGCDGGEVGRGCVNSYVGTTIGRPLVGVGITVICLGCVGFSYPRVVYQKGRFLELPQNLPSWTPQEGHSRGRVHSRSHPP